MHETIALSLLGSTVCYLVYAAYKDYCERQNLRLRLSKVSDVATMLHNNHWC